MDAAVPPKRRVGIVGTGALGLYLIDAILADSRFTLAFVWNRTAGRIPACVPLEAVCTDLHTVGAFAPDVIVEVCHPDVTAEWGEAFLDAADLYVGSPTAFADATVAARLRAAAASNAGGRGLYVAAGALWGGPDISKLADRGSIASLTVTMKKHPESLKLTGELGKRVQALLDAGAGGETVLYSGPVRALCPLAPNNVNTMAVAAIAAHTLGFDGVQGVLVSDPSLAAHVITVDVRGPVGADGQAFHVVTERYNPAPPGAITGRATYASFFSSLVGAGGRGRGVWLC
jgi:aspartate dehydrogenase